MKFKKLILPGIFFATMAVAFFQMNNPAAWRATLKQEGFPTWWADATMKNDGKGHLIITRFLGPDEAEAQQPAGGGTGGATVPKISQITGQVAVSAGAGTLRLPAIGVGASALYTNCFISIASPLPAVAGNVAGCVVTSTATVTGSPAATSTVGAINIQAVGTSSATYSYILTQ